MQTYIILPSPLGLTAPPLRVPAAAASRKRSTLAGQAEGKPPGRTLARQGLS
jgi:hypothetical protein